MCEDLTSNDVCEPSTVGARLVPEGPNVALEEARGLMHDWLTPGLTAELASAALARIDDELAVEVLMKRLRRADPDSLANVAEQLVRLFANRYNAATEQLQEAEALRRDAGVIRCNALRQRRSAELCALTMFRAVPPMLAARLFGEQPQGAGFAGEAE